MLPHPQHPHNNNPTPSTVDIALRNEMVAVEVDGSAHWTQNEPYVPLGRTIWRWRILASRGWRLVSVPYFRWARLESLAAKKQYLWQLLQASGVRVWGVCGGGRGACGATTAQGECALSTAHRHGMPVCPHTHLAPPTPKCLSVWDCLALDPANRDAPFTPPANLSHLGPDGALGAVLHALLALRFS